MTHRTFWTAFAGMALIGAGLAGPTGPAAAAPADRSGEAAAGPAQATLWEEPIPGTSAEIGFSDAVAPARAASMSPHLAEIVRGAKRVRTVDIEAGALAAPLAAESVAIELFANVSIDLETTVALSNGARSSSVYSAGGEDGAAILTIAGADVHGALWHGTAKYGIEPLGNGRHLVYEEGRTFPDGGEPLAADGEGTDPPAGPGPTTGDAGTDDVRTMATTVIDIMVAYDSAALAKYGSVAATEAEITEMINLTNMVYANSQLDIALSLTNTLGLSYTPNAADGTTNDSTYLAAVQSQTDGIVDELHAPRSANNADLVGVITDLSGFCGRAYYPSSDNSPTRGFSLSDADCAVATLIFPHELGHNLCAAHDPVTDAFSPCAPDGFGHFDTTAGFRTVMSYPNPCPGCTLIPHYSNPNVTHEGWSTGILGERDNARVIGLRAPDIAAYLPIPPACEVDYTITGSWPGNVQVDLAVTNNRSSTIGGWTAEWTFTGDESVYNSWGVIVSQVGSDATATGDGFGASIPAGGTVTVGFQATVTGTPTAPAAIACTA